VSEEQNAFKRWYEGNKDSYNQARKERYANDPEYRQKILQMVKPKNKPAPPPTAIELPDAAVLVNRTPARVYELINKGLIPPPFHVGRKSYFYPHQVEFIRQVFEIRKPGKYSPEFYAEEMNAILDKIEAEWDNQDHGNPAPSQHESLTKWKPTSSELADIEDLNIKDTERDAIVKARIGQSTFRQRLIDYWLSCAVTGCKEQSLLLASHIKPWSKSTQDERLDIYNGILLSPALDRCFDNGYIGFDDEGKILISEKLSSNDKKAMGIDNEMRLNHIKEEHKKYLAFHRKHEFKKGP